VNRFNQRQESVREIVGLMPAGGQARRIAPLPISKELFPIGFRSVDEDGSLRPKVACHYLLEKMRKASIKKVYIVLGEGKWDIPAYLGDGEMLDMHFAYLIMRQPFGVPYTLNQAYPFLGNGVIALGFPDILFEPDDAFVKLLSFQGKTKADVVLGLFPADQPQKVDMVDLDDCGQVRQLVIKPPQTHLKYTWGCAVWTPAFTQLMHEYLLTLQDHQKTGVPLSSRKELFIGDVFQVAVNSGLRVTAIHLSDQPYLDIGTPEDLVTAVQSRGLGA